jgi:hypothetical protein
MKTLLIAIVSIALSVAAQFSLKAGMSGGAVKEIMAQPYTLRTFLSVLMDKYVLGGFLLSLWIGGGCMAWSVIQMGCK